MSDYKGEAEERYIFKVILIGDGAVGKTSLVRKYMEGRFRVDYLPTIGTQIYTKTVGLGSDKIKLVVWDISGQPAFTSVRPDYYRGARGVILVFDLTRPETYEHLDGWINETKKYTINPHTIVVGSKSDLQHQRKVGEKAGTAYASKINAPYMETSAKDGKNVEKVFTTLATELLNDPTISQEQKKA
ncbi:MAG: Rab family GTPase [Promethearchaeati archaeon SRVP18_Atabeyarchaeia-1]